MQLSPTSLYALRLSLNQSVGTSLLRRNAGRGTATSAAFLATLGLSLSMFSLKQMAASPSRYRRQPGYN